MIDQSPSRYPYFYTTVPDDHVLNKVRQDVLEHFGWRRVGIFSVEDEYHVSVSNNINVLHRAVIIVKVSNIDFMHNEKHPKLIHFNRW